MEKQKTGFWRGFTWKRFAKMTAFYFSLSLLFSVIWRYFETAEKVSDEFTIKALLARLVTALLLGFLFAVWFEPGVDDGGLNKKKTTE
jgi:hypothetical protein